MNEERDMIRAASGAITGFRHKILMVTSEQIPDRKIVRVVGLVRGNSVRARHVGRDILAVFRNIAGGEIREYTKLLAESREQALDRMAEQALSLGANAVVGLRFSTSMIMGGAAEILAYGTAVIVSGPKEE